MEPLSVSTMALASLASVDVQTMTVFCGGIFPREKKEAMMRNPRCHQERRWLDGVVQRKGAPMVVVGVGGRRCPVSRFKEEEEKNTFTFANVGLGRHESRDGILVSSGVDELPMAPPAFDHGRNCDSEDVVVFFVGRDVALAAKTEFDGQAALARKRIAVAFPASAYILAKLKLLTMHMEKVVMVATAFNNTDAWIF
ncbi:hypothetical protein DEO72_LG8g454 [Vigna unguiculata]|uniref:Uncharacterized protein n=1 Tax=Vigna unguiculata TaxID=3917 RepID=A0A4D6MP75_VIGUN|nr:hypothetical protein DEO72_LG8g454 [Vigna unguiculata]